MAADKNGKTSSSQSVVAPAPTPEVDWTSVFAQLFHQPSASAGTAPGSFILDFSAGAPASGTSGTSGTSGAVGAGAESLSAQVFPLADRFNQPVDFTRVKDTAWADIAHNYFGNDPMARIAEGRDARSGPGFRSIGAFLYYDENGGGFDGTETLLAELRPAPNGFFEIILF
jgi:hypothetical protein